jgi:hypothetical protein
VWRLEGLKEQEQEAEESGMLAGWSSNPDIGGEEASFIQDCNHISLVDQTATSAKSIVLPRLGRDNRDDDTAIWRILRLA